MSSLFVRKREAYHAGWELFTTEITFFGAKKIS